MTSCATPAPPQGDAHPAVATASRVADDVERVLSLDPALMPTADKEAALLAWVRVASLVDAERLRLLAVTGDVADAHGARDAAAWLAHRARLDQADGRRDLTLAAALRERWALLDDAVAQAQVNVTQARVIAHALAALPDDIGDAVRAKAEAWLVEQAAQFGPKELRVLGRRVLDVVAPEVGERAELTSLEAEEARARTLARLTAQRMGDGTTVVRARISDAAADRLTTYQYAYTSPGHLRAVQDTGQGGAEPDPAPYAVRMGRAFEAFLEDVDPRRTPLHGGDATSVVVLVDEAQLGTGVGVATTTTGQQLSIGRARRLACTAAICSRRCATRTTSTRGTQAAAPTSTAGSCSAPTTTT